MYFRGHATDGETQLYPTISRFGIISLIEVSNTNEFLERQTIKLHAVYCAFSFKKIYGGQPVSTIETRHYKNGTGLILKLIQIKVVI